MIGRLGIVDQPASPFKVAFLSPAKMAQHTIVLVQQTKATSTRTYLDFATLPKAMDGVVKMYEQKLKELNPHVRQIDYEVSDLFKYIDSLGDLSCLVFSAPTQTYMPFGKEWIKESVYKNLRNAAGK